MSYNTGNPVPSRDPRDLVDNAEILDRAVNGDETTWTDRLGRERKSWAGMEQDFADFLASSGFEPVHLVYQDGVALTVDRPTQLIDYNGSVYRVKMPSDFPVSLSGTWATDSGLLVDIGDQSLRQELASPSGAAMVGLPQVLGSLLRDAVTWVTLEMFGAKGDGVTDDLPAFNAAIAFCRDRGITLLLSEKDFFVSDTVKTQPDGTYKPLTIVGLGNCKRPTIICGFSGKPGLLVQGMAARQTLLGFTIQPSADFQRDDLGANIDNTSHGVEIQGTRVTTDIVSRRFKGHAVYLDSSTGNSNTSNYKFEVRDSNRGVHVTGTKDDLAVCQAQIIAYGNASSGFYATNSAAVRGWDAWIYAENNCVADASVPGVYVGKAIASDWWIYSEQGNEALEIWFDGATENNYIVSARANKDRVDGTNNVTRRGSVYQGSAASDKNTLMTFYSSGFNYAATGAYNRLKFSAVGGTHGYIHAEEASLGIYSGDESQKLRVFNDHLRLNKARVYSGDVTLSSTSLSASRVVSPTLGNAVVRGTIRVVGRNPAGSGAVVYEAGFHVAGGTLSIDPPTVDVKPAEGTTKELTLNASGQLQLDLSYQNGWWGATYYYGYEVDFILF